MRYDEDMDVEMTNPDENGVRVLTYQSNGLMREIKVKDKQAMTKATNVAIVMAEDDEHDVGANIPGTIVKVVKEVEGWSLLDEVLYIRSDLLG